ncbi:MAG: hypothetical protein ACRDGA_07875 [Bacteroidota bacterium]
MTFEQWMDAIDNIFIAKVGVGFRDLPDLVFVRDLYEDELTPEDAAEYIAEVHADDGSLFAEVWYDGER